MSLAMDEKNFVQVIVNGQVESAQVRRALLIAARGPRPTEHAPLTPRSRAPRSFRGWTSSRASTSGRTAATGK